MEPTVVVVAVLSAALAALIARSRQSTPEREPVPVRVDEEPRPIVRRR
jgi:hypothetical protein